MGSLQRPILTKRRATSHVNMKTHEKLLNLLLPPHKSRKRLLGRMIIVNAMEWKITITMEELIV